MSIPSQSTPEAAPKETSSRRGRPRDPNLETRILDAALELYGELGWLGFNLDGVARVGGVSKDAIYRRWRTREALLDDALRTRWQWIAVIDHGNFREDLAEFAQRTFKTFTGTYGEVALQLRVDTRRFEEVRSFAEPYRELMVQQGRKIVRRAMERGELPGKNNPGLIMDMVVGGIVNHIGSVPRRMQSKMIKESPNFLRDLVDMVIAGAVTTISTTKPPNAPTL